MSKEPSPPDQGDETHRQASTSGSRQASQSQEAPKDGSSGNGQPKHDGNSGVGSQATGQEGGSEPPTEDKNETPEELRQELEALRRELAAQLQKKHSLDRQLVGLDSSLEWKHCIVFID